MSARASRLAPLVLTLLASAAGAQEATLDTARQLYVDGRLEEAAAAFDAVAAAPGTEPADAARALNNSCVVLTGLGSYAEALERCEAARELRAGLPDDRRGLGRTLNNLGLALRYLGRHDEARERFLEALEIDREIDDAAAQAVVLANLGVNAEAAGDYGSALGFHRRAEALARATLAADPEAGWADAQLQVARVNQASVLEKVEAFEEALALYRQVDEQLLAPDGRAQLAENLGVVYRNLGDPVSALVAYERAAESWRDLGNPSGESNAVLNMALVHHLNLEAPEQAEADYRRALELARESGDREVEIRALCFLGRLLLERGALDDAASTYEQAREAATDSGSSEGQWSALEGLARIAAARGETRAALELVERAIAVIEEVRSGLARTDYSAGYFGARRPVYDLAVDLLVDLDRDSGGAASGGIDAAQRALEMVQRAKARDLLDSLGPTRRPVEPLAVSRIRSLLGAEDGVVEYYFSERRLLAWTLRPEGATLLELGPPGPVLEAATAVYRSLSEGRSPAPESLELLASTLLPWRLDERGAGPGHWRIAPDRRLHYLPFEILDDPSRPGAPLVDEVTVSYLPSASALGWLEAEAGDATLTLAGFGDPALPDADSAIVRSGFFGAQFALGALPAARRELEAAARSLGGESRLRLGDEARESTFREVVAEGARVVHVVAHTVVDERPGGGAAILLAPGDGEDGVLHPSEIAELDYHVRVTVLAACRSALGWGEGGASLASLTGSFLAAGSQAVVATLWDVGDEATAVFMERFYHHLGHADSPALALHDAKADLRADPRWSAPALWAPYIVIGEAGSLARGGGSARWLYAVAGAFAALLVWLLWRRRNRTS